MTTTLNASTAGAGGFIATSDNSGSLALQTAGTTAITVDASQNVGIGTTSPATRFDVRCASDVTQDIAYFSRPDAAVRCKISLDGSGLINFGTSTSHPLAFLTGNTERMRIDSSGSVQVGTTSALGSARVTIKTPDSSGSLIPLTLAVGLVSDGFGGISFRNPNGQQGSIVINSTSVSYNTTSDYRLKENAQPLTGALAKVAQIKPVTYQWKINGKDSEGFIAHELAEVCPHAVTGEKDAVDEEGNPKHQGIDTSFLVATLTAALQETKALIDTQAETINALTARIVALEEK